MGATDFIEKPADLEKLTEKIKAAQAKKMLIVEKQTEEKIKKMIQRKFGIHLAIEGKDLLTIAREAQEIVYN